MKRSLSIILCLTLLLGLAACKDRGAASGSALQGTEASDPSAQEKASPGTAGKDSAAGAPSDEGPYELFFSEHSAYANWSEDEKIYKECLNREAFEESLSGSAAFPPASERTGGGQDLPLFRFDSMEDLESFRTAFAGILSMEHGYDEILSFDEAVSGLGADFFEDRSLFLIYVPARSGSFRFGISGAASSGGELRFTVVNVCDPEVCTDDMAGWFLMAELEKEAIEGIELFSAVYAADAE